MADETTLAAELDESPKKESKPEFDEEEICEEACERFARVNEDDRENRENARDDFKFVYSPGEQWTEEVRQRRKNWNEPCLEFNQLGQFVNQVVGDQRQGRPAILVHPASGQASREVADIEQGMIRGIEYQSKAEAAYDNGCQGAVVGGRGYWLLCTEYTSQSFDQDIFIKPILDPLSVYLDLDYQQPDGSDRNFGFIVEKVQKKDFERRWPDAEPVSWDALDGNWKEGKDVILVADYYQRVPTKRTLVAMSDGAVGWKDTMPTPPKGVVELKSREVETYKVEWHKIAGGTQLLESHKLPGECIPVICTACVDILLDGKRVYQGLIRPARDAQTMFNFGMTQQAVHLALTPKAPWVAPQEAIENYQEIWKNANVDNYSVLPYKHKDENGEPIPAPSRTQPSMPDSGWINWCQTMQGVMRSTIGMYQNSLGQQGTETSGKAIIAREKQGDTGTFHIVDNLHRAIALTGRIIQSWFPTYYDTQRIVHIIGPDDTRKMVTINQSSPDPSNPLNAIRLNDVTVGEYAVVIEAGPGYATKRQETSDKLMQLVQSFPPVAAVAGDLVVKSLDVADADQIAERLKFMLPPPVQQALAAKEENGGKPPDPQIMAKLQQAGQQAQQLQQQNQELQQRNQELESGAETERGKLQVKAQADQADREIRARADAADLALQRERAEAEIHLKQEAADREAAFQKYKADLDARTRIEIAQINKTADLEIARMNAAASAPTGQPS